MSLIYDYLKIHGKKSSDGDSDVEIFPTLKSSDIQEQRGKPLILVICSGIVAVFAIIFLIKILIPDPETYQPVAPTSLTNVQVQKEEEATPPPAPVKLIEKKEIAPAAKPASSAMPQLGVTKPETQVLSEISKQTEIEETAAILPEVEKAEGMVKEKTAETIKQHVLSQDNIPVDQEIDRKVVQASKRKTAVQTVESEKPRLRVLQGSLKKDKRQTVADRVDPASEFKGRKLYLAGLQAQHKGDHDTAETFYRETLELVPDHKDALINLSALYVQQERYIEAETVLSDIIRNDPKNSKALVNLGVIYLYQGNYTRAEKHFKAALDSNPMEENALVNLAYLAEKNKDYIATERYYRSLLRLSPDNLEVLLAYGYLLETVKRYPEAVALYRDCLELSQVKKDQGMQDKINRRMRTLSVLAGSSQL